MLQYNKVIFVSVSDTCRGPWAAAIMKNKPGMSEVDICSKGTISLFPEPANPKAVAVAKSNGIDIGDYQSTQLEGADFSMETLVLVMSESMKKKIYEDFTEAVNVYTIKEDDPLSAKVQCDWKVIVKDDDIDTEVETFSTMTFDEDYYYLYNKVVAYNEGEQCFTKTWKKKIERDFT